MRLHRNSISIHLLNLQRKESQEDEEEEEAKEEEVEGDEGCIEIIGQQTQNPNLFDNKANATEESVSDILAVPENENDVIWDSFHLGSEQNVQQRKVNFCDNSNDEIEKDSDEDLSGDTLHAIHATAYQGKYSSIIYLPLLL